MALCKPVPIEGLSEADKTLLSDFEKSIDAAISEEFDGKELMVYLHNSLRKVSKRIYLELQNLYARCGWKVRIQHPTKDDDCTYLILK